MKLALQSGRLYADGLLFCYAKPRNGRSLLPQGGYDVEVRTATEHGSIPMAYADDFGWLGGLMGCDLVVGRVTGKTGPLPCLSTSGRLVSMVEEAYDRGERVHLEIQP